jgi:hypothetical protein
VKHAWAMSPTQDFLDAVAVAAERFPGPRNVPCPMPGRLDAMVAFANFAEWRAFILDLGLRPGIPDIVTVKYKRAVKLYLLAWIDFDIIKAGEMVALATLELALKDRYGDKVKDKRGNILFARTLRHMVEHDGLTDDKLPMHRRCGGGSVVSRLTGKTEPSLANIRNDLAHGYPFDGFPWSGMLELVRDLIEYAYRGVIADLSTQL